VRHDRRRHRDQDGQHPAGPEPRQRHRHETLVVQRPAEAVATADVLLTTLPFEGDPMRVRRVLLKCAVVVGLSAGSLVAGTAEAGADQWDCTFYLFMEGYGGKIVDIGCSFGAQGNQVICQGLVPDRWSTGRHRAGGVPPRRPALIRTRSHPEQHPSRQCPVRPPFRQSASSSSPKWAVFDSVERLARLFRIEAKTALTSLTGVNARCEVDTSLVTCWVREPRLLATCRRHGRLRPLGTVRLGHHPQSREPKTRTGIDPIRQTRSMCGQATASTVAGLVVAS